MCFSLFISGLWFVQKKEKEKKSKKEKDETEAEKEKEPEAKDTKEKEKDSKAEVKSDKAEKPKDDSTVNKVYSYAVWLAVYLTTTIVIADCRRRSLHMQLYSLFMYHPSLSEEWGPGFNHKLPMPSDFSTEYWC